MSTDEGPAIMAIMNSTDKTMPPGVRKAQIAFLTKCAQSRFNGGFGGAPKRANIPHSLSVFAHELAKGMAEQYGLPTPKDPPKREPRGGGFRFGSAVQQEAAVREEE